MNIDQQLRQNAPQELQMRRESERLRDDVLTAATSDTTRAYSQVLPRVRRRRVLVRAVVVAVVLVVVATGASVAFDGGSPASAAQERFVKAAAVPAYGTYGAFSAGNSVYIGNHQVTFDEKIKAMYYTSAGVLVRMGKVAYTDAGGPSHYTLIRPDGSHSSIDLKMGDRVPATDPESPDVAYAEPTGDNWSYVVINLVTGKEVARTEVRGKFTWGGWEAPPVTMAGHRMWGLFDAGWVEYDWQSGKTRLVPGTKGAPLTAAHGRFALYNDVDHLDWKVKDFVSGKLLRTIPISSIKNFGWFSPDGRYVRLNGKMPSYDALTGRLIDPPGPSKFLTVDTGKEIAIPGRYEYGWTPGGNALVVDAKNNRLTVCDPGTGKCDRIHLKIGSGKVKLGGLPYES